MERQTIIADHLPVWQGKWQDLNVAELKQYQILQENSNVCSDVFAYFWSCGISMIVNVLTFTLKNVTFVPENSTVNIFISHIFIEVHN